MKIIQDRNRNPKRVKKRKTIKTVEKENDSRRNQVRKQFKGFTSLFFCSLEECTIISW